MKKSLALASILILLTLTACNTFEGLGQDVQKGGEKIEDSANNNK